MVRPQAVREIAENGHERARRIQYEERKTSTTKGGGKKREARTTYRTRTTGTNSGDTGNLAGPKGDTGTNPHQRKRREGMLFQHRR